MNSNCDTTKAHIGDGSYQKNLTNSEGSLIQLDSAIKPSYLKRNLRRIATSGDGIRGSLEKQHESDTSLLSALTDYTAFAAFATPSLNSQLKEDLIAALPGIRALTTTDTNAQFNRSSVIAGELLKFREKKRNALGALKRSRSSNDVSLLNHRAIDEILAELRKTAAATLETKSNSNTGDRITAALPEMCIQPASRQQSITTDTADTIVGYKSAASRSESMIIRSANSSRSHSIAEYGSGPPTSEFPGLKSFPQHLRRQSNLSQWSQDITSADNTPVIQRSNLNLSLRVALLKAGGDTSAAINIIKNQALSNGYNEINSFATAVAAGADGDRQQQRQMFYYPGIVSPVDRETFAALTIQRYYRLHKMRQHFSKIRATVQRRLSDDIRPFKTNLSDEAVHEQEETKRKSKISVLYFLSKRKNVTRAKSTDSIGKQSSAIASLESLTSAKVKDVDSIEASLSNLVLKSASTELPSTNNDFTTEFSLKPSLTDPTPDQRNFANATAETADELPQSLTLKIPRLIGAAAGSEDDSQKKLRDKKLRKNINSFNSSDPSKAIARMISDECLAKDPVIIARFLLEETRLSKMKIGEFLGAGDEIHNQVLRAFIQQLDFTELEFDVGLRKLLGTFRLPGEAQKIDRVMNEFARRFCQNNPRVFSLADTAYVLAYSLIMLNTDAHNPNVKKKMTLNDFLRNNRGIDNGKDLPQDLMKRLYLNIVNNEIRMNEHDNLYKISEICAQISGKYENIVQPQRRFLREFICQQIPDYNKPNGHRHDRHLFLFNDLILVAKPRLPTNHHAYNASGGASTDNSSVVSPKTVNSNRTTAGDSLSLHHNSMPAHNRYQFRYLFNMISMHIIEKPDNEHHCNVVELTNTNGRLITLSFHNSEDKSSFCLQLQECIEDVMEVEEEKRQRLQKLTIIRSTTAKALLEKAYSFAKHSSQAITMTIDEQLEPTQHQPSNTGSADVLDSHDHQQVSLPTIVEAVVTDSVDSAHITNPQAQRFLRYGSSLREARLALQAQSGLLTGKGGVKMRGIGSNNTAASASYGGDKLPNASGGKGGMAASALQASPALAEDAAKLRDFGVPVKLAAPSPSPESMLAEHQEERRESFIGETTRRQYQSITPAATGTAGDITSTGDGSDINALMELPTTIYSRIPAQPRRIGSIASVVSLPLMRKRRNTIIG